MHQFCPGGESSWCHYMRAIAVVETVPRHPRALSSDCRDRVFKILELYLEVEFLVRVKGGHSSNLNESLHNNIWTIVSKTKAIDLDLLHFGASLAVIRYNDSIKNLSLSFDKL